MPTTPTPFPKYYASTHAVDMCMCHTCLIADNVPPELAAKIEGIWLRTERRRRQLEAIAKPMYATFLYVTLWAITAYLIYIRYAHVLTPLELIALLCINYVLVGGLFYGLTHHAWWVAIPTLMFQIALYV
jgi:hypothetical protein